MSNSIDWTRIASDMKIIQHSHHKQKIIQKQKVKKKRSFNPLRIVKNTDNNYCHWFLLINDVPDMIFSCALNRVEFILYSPLLFISRFQQSFCAT